MLSALLHPRIRRQRSNSAFSSSGFNSPNVNRNDYQSFGEEEEEHSAEYEDSEPEHSTTLLPIFAADLESIPVYNLVHTIRDDVQRTLDTSLTWDQLRSPQVSSFIVKPVLGRLLQIEGRLSKGIIYSLMANCLQFRKEAEENPRNAATSKTRALLCELLAIKFLKEFSARELIDALSYDFYPLQGMEQTLSADQKSGAAAQKRSQTATASRISALEIAIRAQAKKFIANPVVIQHLESIWAGNIVFHSAYDQLHRDGRPMERRTATIYDGKHASLFKLSRLRIPRYRHIFSTFSLAILLILHLKVLIERSYTITPLEVLFWLWSFGFMIDEIADFNESGVTLYFLSMWNAFDFIIFLLFMTFYALRIVGLFMPDERDYITDWSFDILASCSIFLFPRIFSILDHYRYFSQLIIAFRIMAADMIALLVLIVISCSGFFVAFTFSFAREYSSAQDVSYALFQMVMGFTPAAWETWDNYNALGKFLLVAFLIICHFLIVTILITVLTNSFAQVAANSVEEHQFLVAVNTITLVKNEAIFTYLAPTNIIAWLLHPLRYAMPFRRFVRMNRTVVKATHLPLLAAIYFYERTMLRNSTFVPSDAISGRNTGSKHTMTAFKPRDETTSLLNPAVKRLRRKQSVASSTQQERILEQVFARPFRGTTLQGEQSDVDGQGDNVDSWMNTVLAASPPTEAEGFSRANMLKRGLRRGRGGPQRFNSIRDYGAMVQRTHLPPRDFSMSRPKSDPDISKGTYKETLDVRTEDDDADNEANSVDGDADGNETNEESTHDRDQDHDEKFDLYSSELYSIDMPSSPQVLAPGPAEHIAFLAPPRKLRPNRHHERTGSNNTILFSPTPLLRRRDSASSSSPSDTESSSAVAQKRKASPSGRKSPPKLAVSRPRPIPSSSRRDIHSTPTLTNIDADESLRMVPSSFATQMAMATGADAMLSKLVLAKMAALEETMKDLLKEGRKARKAGRRDD
ncbi:putative integral membrane channel protein [Tricharina praecox]|uniref:putative integral membrane channel protein n=1 Tax=Tricharina praecox TaxID=43433 RepID=UPI00221E6B3A|nr:putative integral membrane channel protein [Tricharina praecox]KAI5848306.1 putative integral membrane channel protein [Tricharina praecox]